jgi:transposase-like protein
MRKIELSEAMKAKLTRLYLRDRLSSREVAERLGIGDRTARRWLHAAGVPLRTNAKRSRLRTFDQGRLFSAIVDRGVVKAAQERGIPAITLKVYLAGLRKDLAGRRSPVPSREGDDGKRNSAGRDRRRAGNEKNRV